MLWCCRQLPKVDLARWQIACNESSNNRQVNNNKRYKKNTITGYKLDREDKRKQNHISSLKDWMGKLFSERQIYDV